MKLTSLSALLLLGALALPVRAETEVTHDPAHVESGTYMVEPEHTRVLWSVSHMGFTTYYGEFTHASGTLELSSKDPAASKLEVHIPVDAVSTPNGKLTGELKGDQWFDAQKYPEIVFKATQVTVTGRGNARVSGELTMHGVTKPVVLSVRFHGAGINPLDKKYTVGFEVSGRVRRSDYGIKTYVPLIGDEVVLTISAAFERQG